MEILRLLGSRVRGLNQLERGTAHARFRRVVRLDVFVWAITAAAAAAIATGRVASGFAAYAVALILRSRASRRDATTALVGAICVRWGDLLVFASCTWLLRDSAWMFAAFGALGGSFMIAYTRARARSLGVALPRRLLARASEMVVVTAGVGTGAWPSTTPQLLGPALLAGALGFVAVAVLDCSSAFHILIAFSGSIPGLQPPRAA